MKALLFVFPFYFDVLLSCTGESVGYYRTPSR